MFSWSILNFFSRAESPVTFYAFLFTIIDRSLRTDSIGSVCRGLSHLSFAIIFYSCRSLVYVRYQSDEFMIVVVICSYLFFFIFFLTKSSWLDRKHCRNRLNFSGHSILSEGSSLKVLEKMPMYLTCCCVITVSSFFLSLINNLQVTLGRARRQRLSELVDTHHTVIDDERMSSVSFLVHLAQNKCDELCISITTPINGSLRTHYDVWTLIELTNALTRSMRRQQQQMIFLFLNTLTYLFWLFLSLRLRHLDVRLLLSFGCDVMTKKEGGCITVKIYSFSLSLSFSLPFWMYFYHLMKQGAHASGWRKWLSTDKTIRASMPSLGI